MHTPFVAALLSVSMAWTPFSSPLTAQQVTEQQTAFESLADSQWVRLAVPDVGRHEGRLLERNSDQLVLSAEPQPLKVPATMIDTLWTRGNAVKTGAIVGALTGLALGVATGLTDPGGEEISKGDAVLILGGIGLGGGALVGSLIGVAIPKWHRKYP